MAAAESSNLSPRITNRRAFHDFFIDSKLECGLMLVGSEVKSLRQGKAELREAFARVEGRELWLFGLHIDAYAQAAGNAAEPARARKLLVHRRQITHLADATRERGVTLVPLAIYFKDGMAKLELGVGRGKKQHDKRHAIQEREMDRDMRRRMMKRG